MHLAALLVAGANEPSIASSCIISHWFPKICWTFQALFAGADASCLDNIPAWTRLKFEANIRKSVERLARLLGVTVSSRSEGVISAIMATIVLLPRF